MELSTTSSTPQKTCRKCLQNKPLSDFPLIKYRQKGLCYSSPCRTCRNINTSQWQKKNPLKTCLKSQRYRDNHPEIKNRQYFSERARKPWIWSYRNAFARCNNQNTPHYKYYGGRGIKLLMSQEDFEFLWNRDLASQMEKPSIDRIDNDGNYELENCRFIELADNIRKAHCKN